MGSQSLRVLFLKALVAARKSLSVYPAGSEMAAARVHRPHRSLDGFFRQGLSFPIRVGRDRFTWTGDDDRMPHDLPVVRVFDRYPVLDRLAVSVAGEELRFSREEVRRRLGPAGFGLPRDRRRWRQVLARVVHARARSGSEAGAGR